MASRDQIHEIGKRKTAIARAYVKPRAGDSGKIRINARSFEEYFPTETLRLRVLQPLEITSTVGMYDILLNIKGGGISGQAGAARHAISKALLDIDAAYRPALKKAGLLTRDSREVERKKYGLAGARKRFQFSKR
jgi:small subunit ribosomal protein S9